eukprot:m51a1_g13982 hypothetical protein (178) ;mRNA; r:1013726-1014465
MSGTASEASQQARKADWETVIQARRSVRRYKPDPVPREVLDHLLRLAQLAPSAMGRNPWQFHVVTSPEVLARIGKETGKQHYNAPVLVFVTVVGGIPSFEDYDTAVATENLCLAATGLGLGSVILAFTYPSDQRATVKKVLGIDEKTYLCPMGIAVGYPDQTASPVPPSRPVHSTYY